MRLKSQEPRVYVVDMVKWELIPFPFVPIFSPGFLAFHYMAGVLSVQRFYRYQKR